MENHFLKRLKNKTRTELQHIVDNEIQYQTSAVEAARHLLLEQTEEPGLISQIHLKEQEKSATSSIDFSASFDFKVYFGSLSYRDLFTFISLSLLFVALIEVLDFYSGEEYISGHNNSIVLWLLAIFLLANHFYYRIEHGRSNNFLGRSINDFAFFIIVVLATSTYRFILNNDYRLNYNADGLGLLFVFIGLVILVFAFESGVAFIKYLLKKIKCQIL